MKIEGLGIIITGAATGLGAATARGLAARGARLVLLDVNEADLQIVAQDTGALPLRCDVSQGEAVEAAIAQAVGHLGEVRALVNVAGVGMHPKMLRKDGSLGDGSQFERLIAVNLTGTYHCCRFAAQHMAGLSHLDGGRGVIVNTASISAFESPVGGVGYAASKAGVVGMTLPMARELGEFGIRVMAIAPGPFVTPLFATFSAEQQKRFSDNMAFPREPSDPKWFAELVGHIVENNFLNGETIRLDGGARLTRNY